ncbi:hypothetical protein B5F53_11985 [Blautia sp. An249]|uniref:hypothetical protein n=1 Tax=Blautia sp. An249 TaxID=1965603 RepID=UPI000B370A51|nr:hypothetical protein [Blautia sp. An249]OUO77924.1 hypothetical protein B5F53_11985 [Blautia sp. An249]
MGEIKKHHKEILNEKLYDTARAEVILDFSDETIFKTKKGSYFSAKKMSGICVNGDVGTSYVEIKIITEDYLKDMLGRYYVDEYIRIFGEVEEA